MTPLESIKTVLGKYATFGGRARRSEYWWFALASTILTFVLQLLSGGLGMLGASQDAGPTGPSLILLGITLIVSLALIIPSLAVGVRRLHDAGHSGWWLLITLIPFIGSIILLIFMVADSQPGTNKWGPSPKTGATSLPAHDFPASS